MEEYNEMKNTKTNSINVYIVRLELK